MSTSLAERKSFEISKREVWQAYERVKTNKGASGVDAVSLGEFEADLRGNPATGADLRSGGLARAPGRTPMKG